MTLDSRRYPALPGAVARGLCALVLGLSASVAAQTQEAPNWNLTAPATTSRTTPPPSATLPMQQQRRQMPGMQQQLPASAAAETNQVQATQVPDGYHALHLQSRPAPTPQDQNPRIDSHLPEASLPEDRQIAILRKRVAELIRQMDDLQARMAASEQALASHRHSYSIPNMGFINVESYNSYLERQQRSGQPIPYFSGGMVPRTTEPPMVPR